MRYVTAVVVSSLFLFAGIMACKAKSEEDWAEQRYQMVAFQIEARGIKDPKVLEAMRKVPRHEFVPSTVRAMAYWDTPLPIGLEQTISQPYIVGYMTEAMKLTGTEKVLEIGTGSGYQAAVLAEICPQVYSIEILCELAERAKADLARLGYGNVTVKCGDGYQGWAEHAPFDAIIVTAAPPHIPQPLIDQLAVGGRMVIPVGETFQKLILVTKGSDGVVKKDLIPVLFVPMTGPLKKGTPEGDGEQTPREKKNNQ